MQIGAMADLAGDVLLQARPQLVVVPVYEAALGDPVGVEGVELLRLHLRDVIVVIEPIHVGRHVVEQPALLVGHPISVSADRRHPVRRALEDREVRRFARDLRHQLRACRAGADECDPLAAVVVVVVPSRGVERLPAETRNPSDVGYLRRAEQTGRADDDPSVALRLDTVGPRDRELPEFAFGVPLRGRKAGSRLDVVANAVAVDNVVYVDLQLGARREVAAPRIVLLETVLVEEARDVDTRLRIVVELPRFPRCRLAAPGSGTECLGASTGCPPRSR